MDFDNERAGDELGLQGGPTSNYDRAMDTDVSGRITVLGMAEGWFTERQFASDLPPEGVSDADLAQFYASYDRRD